MRRVISLTVEFPSIPTDNLRTAIKNTLIADLDLAIFDIFDGVDVREQDEPVQKLLSGIQTTTGREVSTNG